MKKLIFILITLSFSNHIRSSDFGTTGIIDTPTARMLKDGTIRVNFSSQKTSNITNITFQATPWLQTTFRYTIFNPENSARQFIPNVIDGLNDRSYAAKITLKKENTYTPELAIGIRDLIGTGAWGSEYLVASKKINNFDFSLGLGWGRLAERDFSSNPLAKINNSFSSKIYSGGEFGGKIRFKEFFKGENIGLFGGIQYKIPNTGVTILAEYNSDSYKREIDYKTISGSSPISYGLKWETDKNIDLTMSYQQGNQLGFSIASSLDSKRPLTDYKSDPFFSAIDGYALSGAPQSLDLNSWYDSLFYDLDRAGIVLRKADLSPSKKSVDIEISNFKYSSPVFAIKKTLSILEIHIPSDVTEVNLLYTENNFRVMSLRSFRSEQSSKFLPSNETGSIEFLKPTDIHNPTNYTVFKAPNTVIDTNISSRFQLFEPEKPLKHQLFLKINTSTMISEKWSFFGSFAIDIDNNFDQNRAPNSNLPHVRTDINRYLTEGSSGIESLYFERKSNILDELYSRFYIGILEQMYSGAGAEILYMPYKSRISIGATVNLLKKRDFDRHFGMLDYETTTGFLSIFYASPFYNYDIALHFGRYLAKDTGATMEIRRTFDNGFSFGAFATITNVSAQEFGEGSFDKGIFFKIPLDALLRRNTKSSYKTTVRSVQRDGGQRLDDFSGTLWHDLRSVRYDSFYNHEKEMIP